MHPPSGNSGLSDNAKEIESAVVRWLESSWAPVMAMLASKGAESSPEFEIRIRSIPEDVLRAVFLNDNAPMSPDLSFEDVCLSWKRHKATFRHVASNLGIYSQCKETVRREVFRASDGTSLTLCASVETPAEAVPTPDQDVLVRRRRRRSFGRSSQDGCVIDVTEVASTARRGRTKAQRGSDASPSKRVEIEIELDPGVRDIDYAKTAMCATLFEVLSMAHQASNWIGAASLPPSRVVEGV